MYFDYYREILPDKRLDNRSEALLNSMSTSQSALLSNLSETNAEQVAYSRLLNNPAVEESALLFALQLHSREVVAGRGHLLCLEDTTEVNYRKHKGRIEANSGLGLVGNDKDIGFFAHISLVLDASTSHLLACSDAYLWTRSSDRKRKKGNHGNKPIEEKESYRWISRSVENQKVLGEAAHMTIVQDREGDIYESFCLLPNEKTDLLIRSRSDRRIEQSEGLLYDYLASQVPAGTYEFKLAGDKRVNRSSRTAKVSVRFCQVDLVCPAKKDKEIYPSSISVNSILVEECAQSVPKGEKPVCWRLLTTHSVVDLATALVIIRWYCWRWHIEQFFRILKKKGLDIEGSDVENGWALRKLFFFSLQAAVNILQLVLARTPQEQNQAISDVFDSDQQQCLALLNEQLEGATNKQKNSHEKKSELPWAAWIIARLGGWKGYAKSALPGPITMKKGLAKFYDYYYMYRIMIENNNNHNNSS